MRQVTEFEEIKVGQTLLRVYEDEDTDALPTPLVMVVTEVNDGDVKWFRVRDKASPIANGVIYEAAISDEGYVSTYVLKEAVPTPEPI